jgi:hypothetical protein
MQNDVEKAALEFQYYIFGNNIFIKTGSLHNMGVFIIVESLQSLDFLSVFSKM